MSSSFSFSLLVIWQLSVDFVDADDIDVVDVDVVDVVNVDVVGVGLLFWVNFLILNSFAPPPPHLPKCTNVWQHTHCSQGKSA